jgi:xanthine/uracil permease
MAQRGRWIYDLLGPRWFGIILMVVGLLVIYNAYKGLRHQKFEYGEKIITGTKARILGGVALLFAILMMYFGATMFMSSFTQ